MREDVPNYAICQQIKIPTHLPHGLLQPPPLPENV